MIFIEIEVGENCIFPWVSDTEREIIDDIKKCFSYHEKVKVVNRNFQMI